MNDGEKYFLKLIIIPLVSMVLFTAVVSADYHINKVEFAQCFKGQYITKINIPGEPNASPMGYKIGTILRDEFCTVHMNLLVGTMRMYPKNIRAKIAAPFN